MTNKSVSTSAVAAWSPELNDLLRGTSRSFYLTVRVLPRTIRPQIGVAYLLARATDTIADTDAVSVADRLTHLQCWRERLMGEGSAPLSFQPLIDTQEDAAEQTLLVRGEEIAQCLRAFDATDQRLIREVLSRIISGQELDLRRFLPAGGSEIVALADEHELDDYTYRVAGCVGGFWTKMCRRHLYHNAPGWDQEYMLENGIRFGKGLQLVNILRDLPRDLRQGRCYLPAPRLRECGLIPSDLLQPEAHSRLRPLYHDYLERAESHLHAGWNYTLRLPRSCARLKLACAWPLLIGLKTLRLLAQGEVFKARQPIRIRRSEVRAIILQTVLRYPFPHWWERLWADYGDHKSSK